SLLQSPMLRRSVHPVAHNRARAGIGHRTRDPRNRFSCQLVVLQSLPRLTLNSKPNQMETNYGRLKKVLAAVRQGWQSHSRKVVTAVCHSKSSGSEQYAV